MLKDAPQAPKEHFEKEPAAGAEEKTLKKGSPQAPKTKQIEKEPPQSIEDYLELRLGREKHRGERAPGGFGQNPPSGGGAPI